MGIIHLQKNYLGRVEEVEEEFSCFKTYKNTTLCVKVLRSES